MKRRGVLLVVSGPSGVGKGTVINLLLERHPELRKSVSCTTRSPRPGEVHGEDYLFIDGAEFASMVASGEFLEYAVVHQDLRYGTPRKPVEEALDAGQDMTIEIDYQGARSVRHKLGNRAVLVFIAPPSWQELVARLEGRKTESPEATAKRLASARKEFRHIGMFEYIVVNDDLEDVVDQLEGILLAERCRLGRNDWQGLQEGLETEGS